MERYKIQVLLLFPHLEDGAYDYSPR